MPDIPQGLPSGTTKAADRARRLALWIGPSLQPSPGTLAEADLLALGTELAAAHDTILRAIAQAHPGSASDLLDDLESQHGLPNGGGLSTTARRTRLLAKLCVRREATENAILATVQTFEPAASIVGVAWTLVATTRPLAVHRFAVVIPVATWNDTETRESIRVAVEQQKPAHTEALITTQVGFYCDDPNSLTDRDLLRI